MSHLGRTGVVYKLEPLPIEITNPSTQICFNVRKKLLKSNSLIQQINLCEIQQEIGQAGVSFPSSRCRQTQQQLSIKSRFVRMIELQNKNLIQRNQLEKDRLAILKQQQIKIKSKANRIKDQRSHSGVTTRNWKVKNMQQGAIVRSAKLQNQYLLAKREMQELKDKKSIVSDLHKTMVMIHGQYADSRNNRKYLKAYQEYKCGMISQITQIRVTPRSIQKGVNEHNSKGEFGQHL